MKETGVDCVAFLRDQLKQHEPTKIPGDHPDAAVLLTFVENDGGELELVFTVRALHMNANIRSNFFFGSFFHTPSVFSA